jgi:hypothetical protein
MKKSDDELAEMFYDEVMEQAGIEKYPPLKSKEEDEMEEWIRNQRTGGGAET